MKKITVHIDPNRGDFKKPLNNISLDIFIKGSIKFNYSFSYDIKYNEKGNYILTIWDLQGVSLTKFLHKLLCGKDSISINKSKYQVIKIKIS